MNKAIISIGSNEDREENLSVCRTMLNEEFTGIFYSPASLSTPYGEHYRNDFLNQLACIYTNRNRDEIVPILKEIEYMMGRKAEDKMKGIVRIDIDLVIWNNETLRPNEMNRSYIKDLLVHVPE